MELQKQQLHDHSTASICGLWGLWWSVHTIRVLDDPASCWFSDESSVVRLLRWGCFLEKNDYFIQLKCSHWTLWAGEEQLILYWKPCLERTNPDIFCAAEDV